MKEREFPWSGRLGECKGTYTPTASSEGKGPDGNVHSVPGMSRREYRDLLRGMEIGEIADAAQLAWDPALRLEAQNMLSRRQRRQARRDRVAARREQKVLERGEWFQ